MIKVTESFFIVNNYQHLQVDPVGILQTAYRHQILNNIQESCLNTICAEPRILFNSDKFANLPAPLLEIILKRDDLNSDEIEVWNSLNGD